MKKSNKVQSRSRLGLGLLLSALIFAPGLLGQSDQSAQTKEAETDPTALVADLLELIESGAVDSLTEVKSLLSSEPLLDGTVSSSELKAPTKASSVALYDNLGWTGESDPVVTPNAANEQKILELIEEGTSNAFEVNFNRIQPGTIITNLPITINQDGGFYYLIHDLTNTVNNGDGITIDANDITIDLMGHTLRGGLFSGTASDDGIFVSGSQTNIKIRNGSVVGWGGDGINALNADFSIYTDLGVSQNGGDGLVTDFNGIINRVTAFSNGIDGIEGDDGTVIFQCTAGQNGDNGIQTSEGCGVYNSASFDNRVDGFDIAAGGIIKNCTATDNGVFGFDMAIGTTVVECTAYDNVSNGFDIASACVMRDCISSLNSGHGVRTFANSYVTDSKFHENDLDGIRVSSTDCHIEGNQTTDNDQTGINATASGSFIVKNTCSGNVTNYNIDPNCAFGPILDVTNSGDLSLVAGADHPWANFSY